LLACRPRLHEALPMARCAFRTRLPSGFVGRRSQQSARPEHYNIFIERPIGWPKNLNTKKPKGGGSDGSHLIRTMRDLTLIPDFPIGGLG
jgi:hypothetical protein